MRAVLHLHRHLTADALSSLIDERQSYLYVHAAVAIIFDSGCHNVALIVVIRLFRPLRPLLR